TRNNEVTNGPERSGLALETLIESGTGETPKKDRKFAASTRGGRRAADNCSDRVLAVEGSIGGERALAGAPPPKRCNCDEN
ncbi:MAG TPA: hypothetical protein VIZ87_06860, partial [Terrimicrobium sp.]